MFYTYVIENAQNRTYTGSTNDLAARLAMHNNCDIEKAVFHRTTYKHGPWTVVFYKVFSSRSEALLFERFLKTGKGRQWLERARLGE